LEFIYANFKPNNEYEHYHQNEAQQQQQQAVEDVTSTTLDQPKQIYAVANWEDEEEEEEEEEDKEIEDKKEDSENDSAFNMDLDLLDYEI